MLICLRIIGIQTKVFKVNSIFDRPQLNKNYQSDENKEGFTVNAYLPVDY